MNLLTPYFLIGGLSLWFGLLTSPAQESSPFGISIPTNKPDNRRYQNQPAALTECKKRVDEFQLKPCDIIFIGETLTDHWFGTGQKIWLDNFLPRNSLNFGLSGDLLANVLWRLENMDIKSLQPKVAVILVGTNDFECTSREIARGVKAVYEKTQEVFPGIKIIAVSLPPNGKAYDKMIATNEIIQNFADDQNIYYLDLVPLMPALETTDANGKIDKNWTGLTPSHYLFTAAGYQLWADALIPLLNKLIPLPPAKVKAPS